MDLMEAIRQRRSVRVYKDKKIDQDLVRELRLIVEKINEKTGFNFQLFTEEPRAFSKSLLNYGRIRGCRNYLALVGPRGRDEDYGYYGQMLVLEAQRLGLNSCWVGLTYKKSASPASLRKNDSFRLAVALGYGAEEKGSRKSKTMAELCKLDRPMPDWFERGMEAAMLAPTSINQQKFILELSKDRVLAQALPAIYSGVDLGIVKYHFEIGAGRENFSWG